MNIRNNTDLQYIIMRAVRSHLHVVGLGNWYRFPNIESIIICKANQISISPNIIICKTISSEELRKFSTTDQSSPLVNFFPFSIPRSRRVRIIPQLINKFKIYQQFRIVDK